MSSHSGTGRNTMNAFFCFCVEYVGQIVGLTGLAAITAIVLTITACYGGVKWKWVWISVAIFLALFFFIVYLSELTSCR